MLYEEFWVLVLFLSLQSAVILDKSLSLWASGSSLLHILQRRQRQKYVFSHTNTQKQTAQSKPFLLQMHTCVSKILVFLRQVCCYCAVAKSVRLLATPWAAACQASLSFTISQSSLKLMSLTRWCPSNHLILCLPLLLLPSIFPSIRVLRQGESLQFIDYDACIKRQYCH